MTDKYGKIVAERKAFHEDEPVFLLRGQDVIAPYAVDAYASYLRMIGQVDMEGGFSLDDIAEQCENIAASMRVWQADNPDKVGLPD